MLGHNKTKTTTLWKHLHRHFIIIHRHSGSDIQVSRLGFWGRRKRGRGRHRASGISKSGGSTERGNNSRPPAYSGSPLRLLHQESLSPPSKETVAFSVLNGRMCRFLSGHGETNRAFFPCQGVSQKITRKEREEREWLFIFVSNAIPGLCDSGGNGRRERSKISSFAKFSKFVDKILEEIHIDEFRNYLYNFRWVPFFSCGKRDKVQMCCTENGLPWHASARRLTSVISLLLFFNNVVLTIQCRDYQNKTIFRQINHYLQVFKLFAIKLLYFFSLQMVVSFTSNFPKKKVF